MLPCMCRCQRACAVSDIATTINTCILLDIIVLVHCFVGVCFHPAAINRLMQANLKLFTLKSCVWQASHTLGKYRYSLLLLSVVLRIVKTCAGSSRFNAVWNGPGAGACHEHAYLQTCRYIQSRAEYHLHKAKFLQTRTG